MDGRTAGGCGRRRTPRGRPRYESRMIWYAWSVGVVVPKRALTTYNLLPERSIVVGTSRPGSVSAPRNVAFVRSRESWKAATLLSRFWTTNSVRPRRSKPSPL